MKFEARNVAEIATDLSRIEGRRREVPRGFVETFCGCMVACEIGGDANRTGGAAREGVMNAADQRSG